MLLDVSKSDMENFTMDRKYGDGLFFFGGDIHCTYPRISVEIKNDCVIFEYEPYVVKISWENKDGKRYFTKAERFYK